MRDARQPSGVWLKDAQVGVARDPDAHSDRITWRTVAVLEVHPRGVPFLIGWRTEQFDAAEFYSDPVETDRSRFAMGVGDQPVWFVARPIDGRTQLVIELVDITTVDDPKYADTPRY